MFSCFSSCRTQHGVGVYPSNFECVPCVSLSDASALDLGASLSQVQSGGSASGQMVVHCLTIRRDHSRCLGDCRVHFLICTQQLMNKLSAHIQFSQCVGQGVHFRTGAASGDPSQLPTGPTEWYHHCNAHQIWNSRSYNTSKNHKPCATNEDLVKPDNNKHVKDT